MATVRNMRKATNTVAFSALAKYFWILPVGFLLAWAIPTLKRLMDRMDLADKKNQNQIDVEQNNFENATANPTVVKAKTTAIKKKYPLLSETKLNQCKNSAVNIAQALGTDPKGNIVNNGLFDLFLVDSWFEDEKTVVAECKKYPGSWGALQDFYFSVATKSRDLNNDLHKYLSKAQLQEIRDAHKKYGAYNNL